MRGELAAYITYTNRRACDPHRLPKEDRPSLGSKPVPSADTVTWELRALFFP